MELISIIEAAEKGIRALRIPHWADPEDHITLAIVEGRPGPWFLLHAWNPITKNRDPQNILITEMGNLNEKKWIPYNSPPTGAA